MKSHYLFCIILLGSFVSPLLAQGVPSQFSYPVKPPPAPEAASLAKCINFPVDYNTGVPRIEIPLFELKGRESSLPLVISYHAGGFKAKEESAYTGLGWSLSSDFQYERLEGMMILGNYPVIIIMSMNESHLGNLQILILLILIPPIIVYECLIMRLILNLINIIID